MSRKQEGKRGRTLRIGGNEPRIVPVDTLPETEEWSLIEEIVGFECASGDWIEREWTGIPVFELLEGADVPETTTHVQFESTTENCTCIPLADLDGALIAIGDGDGFPRFVSPHVIGPRTIKNLSRIRPLTLEPGDEREQYENLPLDTE